MLRSHRLACVLLSSLGLFACVSNDGGAPAPAPDASLPGVDASPAVDAAPAADGAVDAGSGDATVNDAGAPDSAIPDSAADDSGLDAASDATDGGPDAGADAADAGTDAGPTGDYALAFDDTTQPQYVAVPDTARMNLTSAFTMEAWVNLTSAGHTSAASVLGKPYGPNGADTTALWIQSGSLYGAVNLASTSGADTSAWTAANGTWHHVAWTFDETTGLEILYVDGVDSAHQTSTAGVPVYDGHPFLIGADIDFGAFTFGLDGVIDDVRIFGAVRAPAQIARDMAGISPLGDPTLVAYYPFDEGSGAIAHDASPNHFDGALGGGADAAGSAPTWVLSTVPKVAPPADAGAAGTPDGGQRYALQFDQSSGAQYVAVPDTAALRLTSAFTYEAWIEANGNLGTAVVLAKPFGAGTEDSTALWFQGALFAGIDVSSTSGAASYTWPYANGAWHHLAWTYDGTSGAEIVYVDGVSVATLTNGQGTPAYDAHPFLIGADVNGGSFGYGFPGLIDDVRVFSSVRTPLQIATDMTGASPVGDPALVAYYPFDEGAGQVAHDASGNHLDGVLGDADAGTGAPTWVVASGPF